MNLTIEISEEMEDTIIRTAMKRIIEDWETFTHHNPDDKKYYKRLAKAAKRVLAYYGEEE